MRASCSAMRRAPLQGQGKGKLGKFELAQGGTLFLDEVGDMPLIMQSKLLRVLQGEIEKVGREENVAVDVRIVAATNQPLEELIEQKTVSGRPVLSPQCGAPLHTAVAGTAGRYSPSGLSLSGPLQRTISEVGRYQPRGRTGAAVPMIGRVMYGSSKTASSRPSFCVVRRRSTRPTFLWARSPDRLRRPSPQRRGNMEPCGKRPSVLRDSCCGRCWSSAAETGMRLPTGWASAGAHFTANGRKLSCDKMAQETNLTPIKGQI